MNVGISYLKHFPKPTLAIAGAFQQRSSIS